MIYRACFHWGLKLKLPALDEDTPITNPTFYSSQSLCPDSLMIHIFRQSEESKELMPLLHERMAIMRENGAILCKVCPLVDYY